MQKLSRAAMTAVIGMGIMTSALEGSYALSSSIKETGPTVEMQQSNQNEKPNIVFIYSDDHPLDLIGCYGGNVISPNIDRLAEEGMLFNRFYVSSPVCSPSRFSTLTGMYSSRSVSLQQKWPAGGPVNMGWEPGIFSEGYTMPKVLQSNGYVTGMVGKWHQGTKQQQKVAPGANGHSPVIAQVMRENYELVKESVKSCGFDYAESVYLQNTPGIQQPTKMMIHNMEWVTEGALRFIEENQNKPFFLYMPTTLVHGPNPTQSLVNGDPLATPAAYLDEAPNVQPSRASVSERVRQAGLPDSVAGVTWLDDGVGAVLNKLDELGIADSTIVVFACDNGRRGKFTCYDAGGRMGFIIRWSGVVEPKSVCNDLVSNIDFAPTFFDVAGIKNYPNDKVDGKSILPILTGEGKYNRDSLFLEVTTERAVVTRDFYKYIAVRYPEDIQKKIDQGEQYSHWCVKVDKNLHHTYNAEKDFPAYFDTDQLYNLKEDPGEQRNLAYDPRYAEKLAEMKQLLKQYSMDLPHTYGEFKTKEMLSQYNNFSDISNHWAKDYIGQLYVLGMVNGYYDGTFKPEEYVRVDEWIKMLMSALGYQIDNGLTYWAEPWIQKAKEIELIKDGEYDLYERPISRGEVARMAVRALKLRGNDATVPKDISIKDKASIPRHLLEYTQKAYIHGIITGYEDGTFRADKTVTRAESATIIRRILKKSR